MDKQLQLIPDIDQQQGPAPRLTSGRSMSTRPDRSIGGVRPGGVQPGDASERRTTAQTSLTLVPGDRVDRHVAKPDVEAAPPVDFAENRRQIAILRATLANARRPEPLDFPRAG